MYRVWDCQIKSMALHGVVTPEPFGLRFTCKTLKNFLEICFVQIKFVMTEFNSCFIFQFKEVYCLLICMYQVQDCQMHSVTVNALLSVHLTCMQDLILLKCIFTNLEWILWLFLNKRKLTITFLTIFKNSHACQLDKLQNNLILKKKKKDFFKWNYVMWYLKSFTSTTICTRRAAREDFDPGWICGVHNWYWCTLILLLVQAGMSALQKLFLHYTFLDI